MNSQSNQSVPRISVVMGVFNGADFIGRAIDSVLGQTFEDFEFIIVDDGSTDNTADICAAYRDPRIRFIRNEKNLGLSTSLNRGIDAARGHYIARMDADDISYPTRFAHQLAFMDSHPEIGICGTWYERDDGTQVSLIRPPIDDASIRFMLIFDAVFAHDSVFIRRALLKQRGLRYDPTCLAAQDFDFWVRCAPHTRFANLPKIHLRYHFHPNNTSHRKRNEQVRVADLARGAMLIQLGLSPSKTELKLHLDLVHFRFQGDLTRLDAAGFWLSTLARAASQRTGLTESAILAEVSRYWYGACGRLAQHGPAVYRLFKSHYCSHRAEPNLHIKLIARCVLRKSIFTPDPPTHRTHHKQE